jgi:hypothetical protein
MSHIPDDELHRLKSDIALARLATAQASVGYFIGSGALKSAGKQLTVGRIKGPGMRWNVADLNALLSLHCIFLEHSWPAY